MMVSTFSEGQFVEKVQKKGLRATSERSLVFRESLRIKDHFSADDLADRVRQQDKTVSRATVYRTIPLLVEFGVLREVLFGDKHHNYECMVGRKHHEHLVCLRCSKIIEFTDERLETPLEEVCKRFGFKPVAHKTEVTGYCGKCQD